jgi:tetratricopeptide (TPR) repeat protein
MPTELAWKHTMAARFGWTDDVARAWATAAALNEQALSVNPESGQALYQAGYLTLYRDKDYERGVQMAAKGTMLAPSNFQVRGGYGWLLLASMRAEEAVNEFEQALRLSPKRTLWVVESLGRAHEMLGRYDDAAAAFEEVIERGQSTGRMTADSHAWLALIHAAQGREDKAKNSMVKAMKALPKLSAT